jgi:hypothetical protein
MKSLDEDMQRIEFTMDTIGTCPFWEIDCLARLPSLLKNAISIMDYTTGISQHQYQALTIFNPNKLKT